MDRSKALMEKWLQFGVRPWGWTELESLFHAESQSRARSRIGAVVARPSIRRPGRRVNDARYYDAQAQHLYFTHWPLPHPFFPCIPSRREEGERRAMTRHPILMRSLPMNA